jgi:hypothetical protein
MTPEIVAEYQMTEEDWTPDWLDSQPGMKNEEEE